MKVKGLSVPRKARKKKDLAKIKTHRIRTTWRILKSFINKAETFRNRDNIVKYREARSYFIQVINLGVRRIANLSYSKFKFLYTKYCKDNNLQELNVCVLSHLLQETPLAFKEFILKPIINI